jgi:hypothetical protein
MEDKLSEALPQKAETYGKNTGASAPSRAGAMPNGLFFLALFLVLSTFFSVIALSRPADVDEGFHLACSKSVFTEGRKPYLDFFFFQMPLLPYVYGGVMSLFGYTWHVARLLCAFLAAAIGLLLCKYAFNKTRSRVFAASVALIYCFAPFIFMWFTCGRTHVLSTFLLIVSVVMLKPIAARSSTPLYVISGFFLGLSADTRLYFLTLIPALAFHVSQVEKGNALRAVFCFLVGVAAALTINIPFVIADPFKYVLNVVGYHALKWPEGLIANFGQKRDHLLQMLFDYPAPRPTLYLGYIFIFITYGIYQLVRRIPVSRWNPAFLVGGAVFLVSLLPSPTHGQYFSVPIPFFLMLAIDLAKVALDRTRADAVKKMMIGLIAVGAILFAYLAKGKINSYIYHGIHLEGSMPTEGGKDDWNLENVVRVSQAIDELVAPNASVLSLWPGYLLESHVRIMPKTENVTFLEVEYRIPKDYYSRSQTISDAEIREGIRTKRIDLLIYGNSIVRQVPEYKALLLENGYTVARQVGGISLFLSPEYQARGE